MKKINIASLSLVVLFAVGLTTSAAVISENSNPADSAISTNAHGTDPTTVYDTGNYANRVGEYFAPGVSISVLPFQLPTLAAGEVFTNAVLQLQLLGLDNGDSGLANVDLYGLSARASSTVLASDFYAGATPDLSANATLLQANFLTPASPVRTDPNTGPFVTTSTQGDISLAAFLNAQYAISGPGSYVFLRLSYDQNPALAGNDSYTVLTDDAGGANEKPLLTLTTAAPIPEPSSFAFLLTGLGAGAMGLYRKRRAT
ncbi:MAG: PEP-CTERM sorting domain-containing protein [Chthoniobacterales bacterium]|nr:PEP-CTERM sorting domain-containing protein [Chthoniobacterales bacterium]